MIKVEQVVKEYHVRGLTKKAVNNVSFELSIGEHLALLGHNGSGKTTLLRVIGGVELPTAGRIERGLSTSWPIGFSTGVHPFLTGVDNIRFLSRVYGIPFASIYDYVDDFSELGQSLRLPVKTYSAGMYARLAFGLSLAIDFDCYLIDEMTAAGDYRFHVKSMDRLLGRRAHKSFIFATHYAEFAKEICSRALVMKNGRGRLFDDMDAAIEIYRAL